MVGESRRVRRLRPVGLTDRALGGGAAWCCFINGRPPMTKTSIKTCQPAPALKTLAGDASVMPTKPRSRRSARKSAVPPVAPAPATPVIEVAATKQAKLAALLLRDEGATLDQMIALTGWLPHTTRAALTGLRKKGYAIDSDKVDGIRTYRAVAPK